MVKPKNGKLLLLKVRSYEIPSPSPLRGSPPSPAKAGEGALESKHVIEAERLIGTDQSVITE